MTDAMRIATVADEESAVRNAGDWALIAAALMGLMALFAATLQPISARSSVWLPVLFAIAAAAPFVVVGRALRTRGDPWAVGAATALAWSTMIAIAALVLFRDQLFRHSTRNPGAFYGMLGYWSTAQRQFAFVMSTTGYVVLSVIVLASLMIARHARRARTLIDFVTQPGWFRGWALAIAYAAFAIPTFVLLARAQENHQLTRDEDRSRLYAQASLDVRKTLRLAQACLIAYGAGHPNEGFPRDLRAIGTLGSGCFDSTSVSGPLAHARLRYEAGRPDSRGRVTEFWVVAEPLSEDALWRKQYYADESGVMYLGDFRTRDDSILYHHRIPDSPLPPGESMLSVVDSPVAALKDLQHCLTSPSQPLAPYFPMSIEQGECLRSYWVADEGQITLSLSAHFESVSDGTYYLVYRARRAQDEERAAGYVVELRPETYGVDGIRSYWSDELGRVHWTAEDRPATDADPVVDECGLGRPCEG